MNLPALPDDPSRVPTVKLANACTEIFSRRNDIVGSISVEAGIEALRRTGAIEKYVRTKAHKDEARRAARVLETAVGAALDGDRQVGGRGIKGLVATNGLDAGDASRFRLMHEYSAAWWAKLESKALSRTEVLRIIDRRRRAATAADAPHDYDIESHIVLGDFREKCADLADESVDLIFTDPPYDRESLPLYEAAAEHATRVLKPGGSLVMYCGQYLMPYITSVCIERGMRYWWTVACVHEARKSRMTEYGVVVHWKPLLWFVKGSRADKNIFIDDIVGAGREKSDHPWQQAIGEAQYFIDRLTKHDGLIVDFFCGGGTTPLAADRLNHRWHSYEINDESRWIAIDRIQKDREARRVAA